MPKCDIHIWNTTDSQPCWKCEELKYSERLKYKNMANQYYELITSPLLVIEGKVHEAKSSNFNLEEFLTVYSGREIYIIEESVQTNNIRAIVI